MNFDELKAKFKEKSWSRIITIYGLDINLFDHVDVYLSKSFPKEDLYKINTKNCLKCCSPLIVGYNKGTFYIQYCHCIDAGKKIITRGKLECLYTDVEVINKILQEYNLNKTSGFKNTKRYWQNKNISKEEIDKNISEEQKTRSVLSPAAIKGARGFSNRQPEFWIRKGFSKEEAQLKVKETQTKNGLTWYTSRYGEELGEKLFQDRINRWLSTIYMKDDLADINKSKGRTRDDRIKEIGLDEYLKIQKNKIEKIRIKREERNEWCPLEKLEVKELYYKNVSFYTSHSLRYYDNEINPLNLKIGTRTYHIDHKYSQLHGFLNNIPAEVIGSPYNLQVLYWKDNVSKGSNSSISIEKLMKDYNENNYRYPY